jgi:citrate synthase
VKIGKTADPNSSIATANAETIVVRGHDLCKELIGQVSLTEHFWLLVTGKRATAAQARVLDSCLAMQGAVAAGILGCGSVILGSAENAGRFIVQILEHESNGNLPAAAHAVAQDYRSRRQPFPGFGHPLHRDADPRAARLIAVAAAAGLSGTHVAAAQAAEKAIHEITGRSLVLNVSGAIPAVLLDAGFPLQGLKGVPILARAASLVAHLVEEQTRPIGFLLSEAGEHAIGYDGTVPDGFKPGAH